MLTNTPYIYRGMSTSIGDVVEDSDELKEDMIIIREKYSQEDCVCIIARLRNNPSLYGGRLRRMVL